jgi:hypothetical protein
MSSAPTYTSPVAQFLEMGEPEFTEDWSSYRQFGITPQDIAELSRMANDRALLDSDDEPECWAPMHAWRMLGCLQDPEGIPALIQVFQDYSDNTTLWDWVGEDISLALGMIGSAALPALSELMADTSSGNNAKENAVTAITRIHGQYPESRDACVMALSQQLEQFISNDEDLNGHLITALVADFKAIEVLPLIEQAYQANRVNVAFIGDWQDVQVHLGLKEAPDRPPFNPIDWRREYEPSYSSPGTKKFSKNQKTTKRKQQKQARRKNRKKK